MATAYPDEDRFLCSLCLDIFADPRTIPCGHTFCSSCLQNHINTSSCNSSFLCPNCRNSIPICDETQELSTWATRFPRNFALMDIIQAISQAEHKEKDRVRSEMSSLCKLLNTYSSVLSNQSVCGMKTLQQDIDDSAEYVSQEIDKKVKELMISIKKEQNKMKTTIKDNQKSIKSKIELMFNEHTNLIKQCNKMVKLGEEVKSESISAVKKLIPVLEKLKNKTSVFLAEADKELPEFRITLSQPDQDKTKILSSYIGQIVTPDIPASLTKYFELKSHSEDINETELENSLQKTNASKEKYLNLVRTFSVKIYIDRKTPYISSVLVTDFGRVSRIVVCDWANCRIKCFCFSGGLSGEIKTSGSPYGLAKHPDYLALVTLPNQRHILCLNIQNEFLTAQTLNTEKEYVFLSVLSDKRLVASERWGSVDILDPSGHTIRTLSHTVVKPGRLAVTGGDSVIVVSQQQQSLTCLTLSGKIIWISHDPQKMKHLLGVVSVADSDIFVCDKERNCIIQLTSDGNVVDDLILSMRLSEPICLFYYRSMFFIVQDDGNLLNYKWGTV